MESVLFETVRDPRSKAWLRLSENLSAGKLEIVGKSCWKAYRLRLLENLAGKLSVWYFGESCCKASCWRLSGSLDRKLPVILSGSLDRKLPVILSGSLDRKLTAGDCRAALIESLLQETVGQP